MVVHVYSKEGCGRCVAAKEKLSRMGFEYQEHSLQYHVELHDGWRDDGSIEVLAAHAEKNSLPLIRVGDEVFDYSAAMKALKGLRKQSEERVMA